MLVAYSHRQYKQAKHFASIHHLLIITHSISPQLTLSIKMCLRKPRRRRSSVHQMDPRVIYLSNLRVKSLYLLFFTHLAGNEQRISRILNERDAVLPSNPFSSHCQGFLICNFKYYYAGIILNLSIYMGFTASAMTTTGEYGNTGCLMLREITEAEKPSTNVLSLVIGRCLR